MNRTYTFLTAILIAGCGSVAPLVTGALLVDEQKTLEPGASQDHIFTIDTATQIDPALLISIGTSSDGSGVGVLVLTEANFTLWEAGEPYTAQFETATNGSDITVRLSVSGTYRLVISNRGGSALVTYGLQAEVFWTES